MFKEVICMGCECGSGYCPNCKGMILSFFGVLILLNAFVWPKWTGVDGWLAFSGLLLMFAGVWKAYIHGCSCPKKNDCCCKSESKSVHEAHHVVHVAHESPIVHHEAHTVQKAPVHRAKKRKR
jgi:hypothetical protein